MFIFRRQRRWWWRWSLRSHWPSLFCSHQKLSSVKCLLWWSLSLRHSLIRVFPLLVFQIYCRVDDAKIHLLWRKIESLEMVSLKLWELFVNTEHQRSTIYYDISPYLWVKCFSFHRQKGKLSINFQFFFTELEISHEKWILIRYLNHLLWPVSNSERLCEISSMINPL